MSQFVEFVAGFLVGFAINTVVIVVYTRWVRKRLLGTLPPQKKRIYPRWFSDVTGGGGKRDCEIEMLEYIPDAHKVKVRVVDDDCYGDETMWLTCAPSLYQAAREATAKRFNVDIEQVY